MKLSTELKNALHRARCRAFYETKLFVVCGGEQDPIIVQILSSAGGELLQQILHGHAAAFLSADVQHNTAGIHHQRAIAQLQLCQGGARSRGRCAGPASVSDSPAGVSPPPPGYAPGAE